MLHLHRLYITPPPNSPPSQPPSPRIRHRMKMADIEIEERQTGGHRFSTSAGFMDFYELPEGCIAGIISFTSPRDACRLASVSKMFKSAADSDAVWECFLPNDYADVLARSDDGAELLISLSKKQLFLQLVRRPLLIDCGTKSFSLEKSTGKKCYTIAARDLTIIWGDTPRYWAWHSTPYSRFPEVAELVGVCWLEIRGYIKTYMLSPNTDYVAYLIFKMSEASYGFYSPLEVAVKTAGGKTETQNVYLDPEEVSQSCRIRQRRVGFRNQNPASVTTLMQSAMNKEMDRKLPKLRGDGWMEVEIGEFLTRGDEDGEVEISVLEVKSGDWKGGLVVEGIGIRPKGVDAFEDCFQTGQGSKLVPQYNASREENQVSSIRTITREFHRNKILAFNSKKL